MRRALILDYYSLYGGITALTTTLVFFSKLKYLQLNQYLFINPTLQRKPTEAKYFLSDDTVEVFCLPPPLLTVPKQLFIRNIVFLAVLVAVPLSLTVHYN